VRLAATAPATPGTQRDSALTLGSTALAVDGERLATDELAVGR
jgi:hypothetical protein